jgi:sarcosine oxidase subunit alpha
MSTSQKIIASRIRPDRSTKRIQVAVDGAMMPAYEGETIAAVLMVSGHRTLSQGSRFNLARTVYCGMGVCHQCLVTVDGVRDLRACMTRVRPGMQISTQSPPEHSSQ